MALSSFNGFSRVRVSSQPAQLGTSNNTTLDASGEYVQIIGHVVLSTGPGTSATISSAGGKLFTRCSTVTINDVGTDVSFGIQDVNMTTGLGDGTFDVEAVINSTNKISTTVGNLVSMTTGSKTITHGDLIAIVLVMDTKAGSDTITQTGNTTAIMGYSSVFPYRVINTTGSAVKSGTGVSAFSIVFDDGTTVGWIEGAEAYPNSASATSAAYNSSSTNNEYGMLFDIPMKCVLEGVEVVVTGTSSPFNINVYSDPLGTPVLEATYSIDSDVLVAGSGLCRCIFSTAVTLEAGTDYVIAVEPTTTTNLSFFYKTLVSTGNNIFKNMFSFVSTLYKRNTSGNPAFAVNNSYDVPMMSLLLNQIDDGAGGGGGEVSHVF